MQVWNWGFVSLGVALLFIGSLGASAALIANAMLRNIHSQSVAGTGFIGFVLVAAGAFCIYLGTISKKQS